VKQVLVSIQKLFSFHHVEESDAFLDGVKLPKRQNQKFVNLCFLDPVGEVYPLLLQHLQHLWLDSNLIDEHSDEHRIPFWAKKTTQKVPYIWKMGICYGCASNSRTQADCYAFINNNGLCVPAELHTFLVVEVPNQQSHVCALIRQFSSDGNIPLFPWDLLYVNIILLWQLDDQFMLQLFVTGNPCFVRKHV